MNYSRLMINLMNNQRKNLDGSRFLEYRDLKRLSKYIDEDIFTNCCSLYKGINTKNNYMTFYFFGKKVSIRRILYYNFIGEIGSRNYIRMYKTCDIKCINPFHFILFEYKDLK